MKQKMERMQVLNDGTDEEDFKELLQILRSFGEVEVLYDPKKKVKMGTNALNDTEDEETREDEFGTEGCVSDIAKGTRRRRRRSRPNETNTTISTAA